MKGKEVMNNEEIQALMSKLQEAGLSAEDIADGILWPLFRDGKMSKEDLSTLCNSIGLELDEDFDKDEGPKDDGDGAEGISKEEAEDLKEIKPEESKEEFKEKVEEAKADDGEGKPAPDEEKSEDEDEEWKYAKEKIFKL